MIAVLLAVAVPLTSATAQQARYLSAREILNSYTGRTMMWRVVKNPAEPAAIVHYPGDNEIDILYGGQVTPNRFTFENNGTAICWLDRTVCRSFVFDGRSRVYVVNSSEPDNWLDEVTDLTDDQGGGVFRRVAATEQNTGANPAVEAATRPPSPTPAPPPSQARKDYTPLIVGAVAGGLFLWWLSRHHSDDGGSYASGGGGNQPADDYRYRRDPSTAGQPSSAPSYTAPIGGEGGLYGSHHGVGDN